MTTDTSTTLAAERPETEDDRSSEGLCALPNRLHSARGSTIPWRRS